MSSTYANMGSRDTAVISGSTCSVLTLRAGDGEGQHTAINGSHLRVVTTTGGA